MATKDKETDEKGAVAGEDSPSETPSSISETAAPIELAQADGSDLPVEFAESAEGDAVAHEGTAVSLGATRYVHAAFFVAAILVAYLSGKLITLLWNTLAEWSAAVRAVPVLLSYAENERETFGLVAGALIGVITVVQTYRKEHIRRWADDVASELSKVTWPNRETVTNGTIVVVIASMIATAYVAVLDRFWSFVTNLVYGA